MTIEIKEFESIVHCDKCSEYLEIEDTDFESVVIELVKENWRAQKDDNDCWENICPSCQMIPGVVKEIK